MRQVSDPNMVVDGKRIPKNWLAILNVKNTHWEDPVVYKEDGSHMDVKKGFVPERWLDESHQTQSLDTIWRWKNADVLVSVLLGLK